MIVNMNSHLAKAVEIKEQLYDFYSQCKYADARRGLEDLMITCRTSEITAMQSFAKTLINWKNEIINSFIIIPDINKKMNNVLIENRNKTIKLIKHSSNAYTNWRRYRNRVLFVLNDDAVMKI